MLDDRFEPGLVSISPDNKSRRSLKLKMLKVKNVKNVSVILSDAHLKINMNEELKKTTNKNKTISIKSGILNDFLTGMVNKRLI